MLFRIIDGQNGKADFLFCTNMQHYSSSASEPITMVLDCAPLRARELSTVHMPLQNLAEGVVHIEGRLVGHLGIDQTLVQACGYGIGALI